MAVRIVRLDDDTEKILTQLQETTGMTVSALLTQGLLALKSRMGPKPQRTAYEIYEELDLGPGGHAVARSSDSRPGVQDAIRRKLKR